MLQLFVHKVHALCMYLCIYCYWCWTDDDDEDDDDDENEETTERSIPFYMSPSNIIIYGCKSCARINFMYETASERVREGDGH